MKLHGSFNVGWPVFNTPPANRRSLPTSLNGKTTNGAIAGDPRSANVSADLKMIEEVNQSEAIAGAGLSPDYEVVEGSSDDGEGSISLFANRLTQGEWLLEICIVSSVILAVFVIFSAGLLERTSSAAEPESKTNDNGASSASGPASVLGPRAQAYLQEGVVTLERGLDDGRNAILQIGKALKLAHAQARAPRQAMIGANSANAILQLRADMEGIASFGELGFELKETDAQTRYVSLEFTNAPHLRGCVASRTSEERPGAIKLGVMMEADADVGTVVAGYRRSSVRYCLVLDVEADEVKAGRLSLKMPAIGGAVDEGFGENYYKIGDELRWNATVTSGEWIVGRPCEGGLRKESCARDPRLRTRVSSPPPAELLKETVATLSTLLAK